MARKAQNISNKRNIFGLKSECFWGTSALRGTQTPQKSGPEGAKNFEKKVFKGKMAFFGVLRENLAKIWSKWWFRANLNTKIIVFRFWKKFRNFFWKFWEIFQKIPDLKFHIFEKLLLKNAMKHELQGYLKLHKFGGSPIKTLWLK